MPHRPGTQVDLIRLDIMDVSPETEYVIVGLLRRANPSDSPVVGACFLERALAWATSVLP